MGIPYPFYKTFKPFDRKTGKIDQAESLGTNDKGPGLREWPVGEEGTIDQEDSDEAWRYDNQQVNISRIRVNRRQRTLFHQSSPPTINPPAEGVFHTILGSSNRLLAVSQS